MEREETKKRNVKKRRKSKIVNQNEVNSKKTVSVRKGKNCPYYFGFREVIVIMLLAIFLGLSVGSFVTYKRYSDDNKCINDNESTEIEMVYDGIVNDYYGDLSLKQVSDSAIAGMISGLNDPYAVFMDEEAAFSYNEELRGTFTGLGIEVTSQDDEYLTIVSVFENSPALESGLLVGDKIVSLDDVMYTKDQMDDFTYKIKSSKIGDKKKIGIIRDGNSLEYEIQLDTIEVTSVYASVLDYNEKKIGQISINNFAGNTYKQFLNKYNEIKESNLDALVIDLRNNSGGYLSSAGDIASLFLNKGDVIYKKYDGEKTENIINENEKKIDIPVVVLVNSCTASSAEVLASSLNENVGATIVGEKTIGKGSIQKLQALSTGKYIKYTVQEWLTSKGNKVEGVGLVPDVEVSWDEGSSTDVQLYKALDVASSK